MIFLAGMGGNDLVEFATWQGEAPIGWIDVPLEGVGGRYARDNRKRNTYKNIKSEDGVKKIRTKSSDLDDIPNEDDSDDTEFYSEEPGKDDEEDEDEDNYSDPSAGNILKAMVLQVKICENHQNGKDTHVRGFQVFARDDRRLERARRDSARKSIRPGSGHQSSRKASADIQDPDNAATDGLGHTHVGEGAIAGFEESDWMREPEIR